MPQISPQLTDRPVKVPAVGPKDAEVVIIGEAPGENEVRKREPFVGVSGEILNNLLNAVGLVRSECLITNVCPFRPPDNKIADFFLTKTAAAKLKVPEVMGRYPLPVIEDGRAELEALIAQHPRKLLILLGATPLWALFGHEGISHWRGSILTYRGIPAVPTYHPAYLTRVYHESAIVEFDLQRAAALLNGVPQRPPERFVSWPMFRVARAHLTRIRDAGLPVAVDTETYDDYIQSISLAWSESDALCIPFIDVGFKHFWTLDEEAELVRLLREILTTNECVWQNWHFDAQRIFHDWGFIPRCDFDTMVAQQAMYPGLPKNLAYLSSMYLEWHCYWKGVKYTPGTVLWEYNCRDTARTYALRKPMLDAMRTLPRAVEVYERDMELLGPTLSSNLNGCRIDLEKRGEMAERCAQGMQRSRDWLEYVLEHEFNPSSNPKCHALFYKDLRVSVITNRKTGAATLAGSALRDIAKSKPLLKPLTDAISTYRSYQELKSTFLEAELDPWDQRLRTSYAQRTETGRFAARESSFFRGTNLSNVPNPQVFTLPNGQTDEIRVRSMFLPEEGELLYEFDLDRADAQVVAWEAQDLDLMQMFRSGVDIHTENARDLKVSRPMAKRGVHAVNYYTTPRTLAIELGITVKDAENFIKRWFSMHPAIRDWHKRVRLQIENERCISNPFGRTKYFLGRMDDHAFREALAFVPQSTVAEVINVGWKRVYEQLPAANVLLQVHDSLLMSLPPSVDPNVIAQLLRVTINQYDPPLTIPVGHKHGVCWGELE